MSSETELKFFNCRQIIEYKIYDRKTYDENLKLITEYLNQKNNWFKTNMQKTFYKTYINYEIDRMFKMLMNGKIAESEKILTDIKGRRLFQAFTMLNSDANNPVFKALKCFDITNFILTRNMKEIRSIECNSYIEVILKRLREYYMEDILFKELCIINVAKRYFEPKNLSLMQKIKNKSINDIFTSLEFQYFTEALKHKDERIEKILILMKKMARFSIKYEEFKI